MVLQIFKSLTHASDQCGLLIGRTAFEDKIKQIVNVCFKMFQYDPEKHSQKSHLVFIILLVFLSSIFMTKRRLFQYDCNQQHKYNIDACVHIMLLFIKFVLFSSILQIWMWKIQNILIQNRAQGTFIHSGLVVPYGGKELGQHCSWKHQAINWTNVDSSLVRSSDIHLRAIPRETLPPWITLFEYYKKKIISIS